MEALQNARRALVKSLQYPVNDLNPRPSVNPRLFGTQEDSGLGVDLGRCGKSAVVGYCGGF